MRNARSRWALLMVGALAVTACGGSDDASDDAPTAASVPVESELVDDGDDVAETDLIDGTDSNGASTDEVAGDDEELIPLDQVDDIPECQALAMVGSSIAEVLILMAFASFDEEFESTDLVPFELAAFAGLDGQVEVLRNGFPDGLFDSLEPMLVRIEGVPSALDAAGITDEDLVELDAAVAAEQVPQSGPLFDKLAVAAEFFIAEFGPLDDVATAMEALEPVDEDASQAVLSERCPKFAELQGA